MKKGTIVAMATWATLLGAAFADSAAARSVTAATGRARRSEDATCFDFSFQTGAVTGTCALGDFIVPLFTDNSGMKSFRFTSRATTEGAECRAVANDRFGTSLSASPFRSIPVSSTYVSKTTADVAVPSRGVFFADCITNVGARLQEFDHSP